MITPFDRTRHTDRRLSENRITAIIDGKVAPTDPYPALFSSAGTEWSGFLFEESQVKARYLACSFHETLVGVQTAGRVNINVAGQLGRGEFSARQGHVFISPSRCGYTEFEFSQASQNCKVQVLQLDEGR